MTISEACSVFLDEELRIRNLRQGTIQGYETTFRLLQRWAERQGLSSLQDCDKDQLRAWIAGWTYRPPTARQRLSQLNALFRFAVEQGWLTGSPLKALRPPRGESPPTMPLTVAEMRALLAACEQRPKERALILLMRYSGLAIGDAATLSRKSVAGAELTLRRAKSGELVTVELPGPVSAAIVAVRGTHPDYYWWSGRGQRVTCAKHWRARLGAVAEHAGIDAFRPHRLRHTFATALLAGGVSMEEVSQLLGHRSIRTTERYYAPWDRRRRDRLAQAVRKANRGDPLLAVMAPDAVPADGLAVSGAGGGDSGRTLGQTGTDRAPVAAGHVRK